MRGFGGIEMEKPYQRSIFDELDELREQVNYMFRQAFQPVDAPLLTSGEMTNVPMPYRHEMKVDVIEHDNEVIVTADMIPGIEKKNISLDLVNSQALRISCERRQEKRGEGRVLYARAEIRLDPEDYPASGPGHRRRIEIHVQEWRS